MSGIRNIAFDLGGVIMTLDPQQAIDRFKEIGLINAESYLDSYTQQGIFGDMESGKITAEEFRRGLSEICGKEISYEECEYAWLGYRKDLPQRNLDLLLKLRKDGFRCILLSNTNPFMMGWARSDKFSPMQKPLDYFFDALYLSYKCKVMKPSLTFFQMMLDGEGIKAENTLFVDDGKRNVDAAAELGIHTFCPINGSDWTKEIYKYL